MCRRPYRSWVRRGRLLGSDLGAGPHAHQAVDDDRVVRVEPRRDDAHAVDDGPEGHVFRTGDIVRRDRIDELAHLLGADGAVGNQQRHRRRRCRDLNASEHAGRQLSVRVLELGAPADRAGRAIDRVVDEVDLALVLEIVFVDQLELDRQRHAAVGVARSRGGGGAEVAEVRRLIHRELEADRIDGSHRRQQRRVPSAHEVSDRDAPVTDAPRNGRLAAR